MKSKFRCSCIRITLSMTLAIVFSGIISFGIYMLNLSPFNPFKNFMMCGYEIAILIGIFIAYASLTMLNLASLILLLSGVMNLQTIANRTVAKNKPLGN